MQKRSRKVLRTLTSVMVLLIAMLVLCLGRPALRQERVAAKKKAVKVSLIALPGT